MLPSGKGRGCLSGTLPGTAPARMFATGTGRALSCRPVPRAAGPRSPVRPAVRQAQALVAGAGDCGGAGLQRQGSGRPRPHRRRRGHGRHGGRQARRAGRGADRPGRRAPGRVACCRFTGWSLNSWWHPP